MPPDLITFAAVVALIVFNVLLCIALNSTLNARDRAETRARNAERLLNYRQPGAMARLQREAVRR